MGYWPSRSTISNDWGSSTPWRDEARTRHLTEQKLRSLRRQTWMMRSQDLYV